ncbi:hypothetical protein [Alicyclobacillus acidocaldarius]|uniref:Uncharacterized protein n=1 Tax=Alicyclobacillus acidocaldarius (strain Tc-4-1) TaxID=1048834 RepID=F8ICF2_ALIAT|nr:hypothetical protein [Alicyclobacillus acidocaldarius]AEJ42428.1 hypothetical protein TC41_0463 [Alicyclobacillus acidocaldarius subsp. acidocaldarius Tc-4-1]
MQKTAQEMTCVLCGADIREADGPNEEREWDRLCDECVDRWVRDSQSEW